MVAVARKLAIVLHRMWRDGTEFRLRQGGGRGLSAGRNCIQHPRSRRQDVAEQGRNGPGAGTIAEPAY